MADSNMESRSAFSECQGASRFGEPRGLASLLVNKNPEADRGKFIYKEELEEMRNPSLHLMEKCPLCKEYCSYGSHITKVGETLLTMSKSGIKQLLKDYQLYLNSTNYGMEQEIPE